MVVSKILSCCQLCLTSAQQGLRVLQLLLLKARAKPPLMHASQPINELQQLISD
jgi:hypothetical protein